MNQLRTLIVVPALSLASLAMPHLSRAQGNESLVLIGVEPATGALVPLGLEFVRRPGELGLDVQAGTLSVTGAAPAPTASVALLGFEPAGTLVALDLRPVRRPGAFRLDPQTGTLTAEGMTTPSPAPAAGGPMLVGLISGTGTLVPMAVELVREPGSYAIDSRGGILSPPPREPVLLAFDPATRSLVPVRLAPIRGQGGLSVDAASGRLSRTGAPPGAAEPAESFSLLGTRAQASGVLAVDLDLVYRGGVLGVDPSTGALLPAQPAAETLGDDPQQLGAHAFTGALGRVEFEPVPISGEFALGAAGTLSPFAVPESSPTRGAEGIAFGVGLDMRQMLKLQDVLEEVPGSIGADAGELAPGIHGLVEYAWRAMSIGIEAAYSVMDTEVLFPQGPQSGDLTYREIGGNAKITVPVGESVRPYAAVAILRSWSKADFEIEGLSAERTHNTTRTGIGAGADYWVRPHLGLRFEALYITTFEDSDAGEQIRWRVGAMYSPRGVGP